MDKGKERKTRSRLRFKEVPLCISDPLPDRQRSRTAKGRSNTANEREWEEISQNHVISIALSSKSNLLHLETSILDEVIRNRDDHIAERPQREDDDSDSLLKITNWRVIWALLMTCGTRRLRKEQYQSVRVFTDAFSHMNNRSWKTD